MSRTRARARVCVILSKTKTAETKITKLGTGILPSQYLAHQLILDQKVKGQDHSVTKCKKAFVSYAVYQVPSL